MSDELEQRLEEAVKPIVEELSARLGVSPDSDQLVMATALDKALRAGVREGWAEAVYKDMTSSFHCPGCGKELLLGPQSQTLDIPDVDAWADEYESGRGDD